MRYERLSGTKGWNMGLGIIIWILGITETLIYYYFVSSLTDQEFETHRFYFLVCGNFYWIVGGIQPNFVSCFSIMACDFAASDFRMADHNCKK